MKSLLHCKLLRDIISEDDGEGDMQWDWSGDHKGGPVITKGDRQPEIYTLFTRLKLCRKCVNNVHHYMGYFTHS